jgi:hypothetical protein
MSAFAKFIRRVFRADPREAKTSAATYGHGLEAQERRKTMYFGRGVVGFGFAPERTRKPSTD